MSRRRRVLKRDTQPDPRYNNRLVQQMINVVMRDGKKSLAEGIIYDAFDLMKKEELSFQTLQAIGQLPSREVLLGQVLGGLIGPLKKLMFVMSKIGEAKKA